MQIYLIIIIFELRSKCNRCNQCDTENDQKIYLKYFYRLFKQLNYINWIEINVLKGIHLHRFSLQLDWILTFDLLSSSPLLKMLLGLLTNMCSQTYPKPRNHHKFLLMTTHSSQKPFSLIHREQTVETIQTQKKWLEKWSESMKFDWRWRNRRDWSLVKRKK